MIGWGHMAEANIPVSGLPLERGLFAGHKKGRLVPPLIPSGQRINRSTGQLVTQAT